jgi:hypothetical protein
MRPGSGARCCNAVFLSEPTPPPPRPLSTCAHSACSHTRTRTALPLTRAFIRSAPQYAFNLFSHTTAIGANGYNEEEMKLVKETRKIWGVRAAPLCVSGSAALRCAALRRSVSGRDADDDYISPITDLNRGLGRWRHTLCTTLTLSPEACRTRPACACVSASVGIFRFLQCFRLSVFVRRGADDDYNSPITDLIRGPRATGRQNVMHHSDAPLLMTTLMHLSPYLHASALALTRAHARPCR